ncbi:MAG: HlyC/CorC family transporter [Saprospiraceae bacterium]|nr:HlyC/CorC family transporter [Saprospiraceae bacterium]
MTLTLLILLFLLLSALFSGSEIAFVSANKLKVELKKKKGTRRSRYYSKFYDKPSSFIGTMLVGNNIVLVVFTFLMALPLNHLFANQFGIQNEGLLLLLNTLIISILLLIFGEFMPKAIFRLYADDILYQLALPMRGMQVLLAVPSWFMIKTSDIVLRLAFKTPAEHVDNAFTRLDLEHFINDTRTDLEEEIDKEMFGKVLNLNDIRVRDCMVPRTEVESIDINAEVEELERLFKTTKLSRILVTENEVDNVCGYVHHQQLLKQPQNIKNLILSITYVPEAMRATDLMNNFIKERNNIACVVDEFGGLAGVITLEDILEEIFGEIEDEHDDEEYIELQESDGIFRFSGRLEINYLNEKYKLDFPEGEYHTLSGYLVMTTESIPEPGAEIELDGYRFIFEVVSDKKIETVKVIRLSQISEAQP